MNKIIKLNKKKREALNKKWSDIVWNNMHLEADEDLEEAQAIFREKRSDVWDEVITPQIEDNFPMAEMNILKKYETGSYYRSFTTTDRCFVFKPSFNDDDGQEFTWNMSDSEFNALYHYELLKKGCEPTVKVEWEETCRRTAPPYYNAINNIADKKQEVARENNTYEDYALCENMSGVAESDFGKYNKVVVSGGCHSRQMMIRQDNLDKLHLWAKAQTALKQSHIALWKVKYQLITDMKSVIDQAKTLEEVEKHWSNVKECISFDDTTEIGTALQIVSEETATRLSQAINNIDLPTKGEKNIAIVVDNNSATIN